VRSRPRKIQQRHPGYSCCNLTRLVVALDGAPGSRSGKRGSCPKRAEAVQDDGERPSCCMRGSGAVGIRRRIDVPKDAPCKFGTGDATTGAAGKRQRMPSHGRRSRHRQVSAWSFQATGERRLHGRLPTDRTSARPCPKPMGTRDMDIGNSADLKEMPNGRARALIAGQRSRRTIFARRRFADDNGKLLLRHPRRAASAPASLTGDTGRGARRSSGRRSRRRPCLLRHWRRRSRGGEAGDR